MRSRRRRLRALQQRLRAWFADATVRRVVVPLLLFGEEPTGAVLVLGSGAGRIARALRAGWPRLELVVALREPDLAMLVRKRVAVDSQGAVEVGHPSATAYPAAVFDAVVSVGGLEEYADWPATVAEIARVVRPGGRVVGCELGRWTRRGVDRTELAAALSALGFDRVRTRWLIPVVIVGFRARRRAPAVPSGARERARVVLVR